MHPKWHLQWLCAQVLKLLVGITLFLASPLLLVGAVLVDGASKVLDYANDRLLHNVSQVRKMLKQTPEQAGEHTQAFSFVSTEEAYCENFERLLLRMSKPSHPWHNWDAKQRARLWKSYWEAVDKNYAHRKSLGFSVPNIGV